ncbi:MAG: hypothetical protein JW953_09395 [Anaerolineae bacterium]|nr:hypothetical protein [Anaerolineae bacterium]
MIRLKKVLTAGGVKQLDSVAICPKMSFPGAKQQGNSGNKNKSSPKQEMLRSLCSLRPDLNKTEGAAEGMT